MNMPTTCLFLSETDQNCCQKIKINKYDVELDVLYGNYAYKNKAMPFSAFQPNMAAYAPLETNIR